MSAAGRNPSRVLCCLWVLCTVVVGLPACERSAVPSTPWAAPAVERFEAEQQAARSDVARFALYFDPSFAFEEGGWVPGGSRVDGRADLAPYLEDAYGDAFEELIYQELFIDDAGAVAARSVLGTTR